MIDNPSPAKTSADARPNSSPPFWLGLWGGAAALLSLSGAFTYERRYLVPIALLGSLLTLVTCYRVLPRFRAWVSKLDLRAILALHVLRAPIGVGFLVMEARGELTGAFARVAGYGDILVGLLAAALLASFGRADTIKPSRALLCWNALGLLDIAIVVFQAQRLLLFVDPQGMISLAKFPGSMLPSFVVPLVVTTHLLVFLRAHQARTRQSW